MSDQCKHCVLRGDIKSCENAPCFHRESWYVEQLQFRHNALEAHVARLEEHGTKLLEACECADFMGDLTEHVSGDLMFNFRRALEEK